MFINSEMIVGLWLVPVVLCIVVPLLMLCAYSVVHYLRKIHEAIKQMQRSLQQVQARSHVARLPEKSIA